MRKNGINVIMSALNSIKLFSSCYCKNQYDILKTHYELNGFASGRYFNPRYETTAIHGFAAVRFEFKLFRNYERRSYARTGFDGALIDDFSNTSYESGYNLKIKLLPWSVYLTLSKQRVIDVENFSATSRACQFLFAHWYRQLLRIITSKINST